MKIAIREIEIIDWYDGPVSALIRSDDGTPHLIYLLAFDPDTLKRMYAGVSIGEDEYGLYPRGEGAPRIEQWFERLSLTRSAFLFSEMPVEGRQILVRGLLPDSPVKRLTLGLIDEAISDEAIDRWLRGFQED